MARRMIDSRIRSSETFAGFTLRQRDLWHGLLVVVDDQGRMPANPAFVRAQVWPFDDFSLAEVETDLAYLEAAGNIFRYQVDGRAYLQIVNWWKYQAPQWCNSSTSPAPDGWVDRVRIHKQGGKIELENWSLPGGFSQLPTALPTPLPTPLPTNIEKSREENEERREEKGIEGETGDLQDLSAEFVQAAGLPEYTGGAKYIDSLSEIRGAGALPGDITKAVQILRDKSYTISGPWSLVNTVRGIIGNRNGTVKGQTPAPAQDRLAGVPYLGS